VNADPIDPHQVTTVVYRAIDELNQMRSGDDQLEKTLATKLAKPRGPLDSMSLINLIMETEQLIEDHFGVQLDLADQTAVAEQTNPLESVAAFVEHLTERLNQQRQ